MSLPRTLIWAAACALLVSACGRTTEPGAQEQEHNRALQRSIQEPIDRARAVESQLEEQQRALQRQLDDAEG